eukprot:2466996-Pyramimonas_sp.AAC.1
MHHPEGWRTIAAVGPRAAIVCGVDEYGGDVWAIHATMGGGNSSDLNIDFTMKSKGAVGVLACTAITKVRVVHPHLLRLV